MKFFSILIRPRSWKEVLWISGPLHLEEHGQWVSPRKGSNIGHYSKAAIGFLESSLCSFWTFYFQGLTLTPRCSSCMFLHLVWHWKFLLTAGQAKDADALNLLLGSELREAEEFRTLASQKKTKSIFGGGFLMFRAPEHSSFLTVYAEARSVEWMVPRVLMAAEFSCPHRRIWQSSLDESGLIRLIARSVHHFPSLILAFNPRIFETARHPERKIKIRSWARSTISRRLLKESANTIVGWRNKPEEIDTLQQKGFAVVDVMVHFLQDWKIRDLINWKLFPKTCLANMKPLFSDGELADRASTNTWDGWSSMRTAFSRNSWMERPWGFSTYSLMDQRFATTWVAPVKRFYIDPFPFKQSQKPYYQILKHK